MKTILTFAFVAFLAVTTSAVATTVHPSYTQASVGTGFSFFRAHRQGNAVSLTWSINTPDVVGFSVERSYDGDFFDCIGNQSSNGSAQYKFADREVFPGTVHYRITAYLTDGTTVTSSEEVIRIIRRG